MKVFLPWNNLGCLGIKIGRNFYCDFFVRPYFGMYISRTTTVGKYRYRVIFRELRIVPDKHNPEK